MIKKGDIVHIDPKQFVGHIAPLGFLNQCCSGCRNEYSSSSNDSNRVDTCLYCIENKLEPAYKRKIPFNFERGTGKITY